ncbi:hypothetical protein ACFQHV_15825 [Promicromonospora thailandica]|uniref:hypothetical protein n=1 Tax=Promicromonospora thailandica TaxID=765201 RepID=UPI0020A49162|nr:hypothetical protein [Promicromonospora thailandica]BFF20286.1 hypothetical protein GCM10025730_38070 [Promicromonospora thailandica]
MEAYEQFVALALEAEGLVVSSALKFPVARQTPSGLQTHGYEVDLIGARADKLVLATVKSFFGSIGVMADHVSGAGANKTHTSRYKLLNDAPLRSKVVTLAAERFGYAVSQVELRLYVGKFGPKDNEERTRAWCKSQVVGAGPIKVLGAPEVVKVVRHLARPKQYRDSAVLATIKVLNAAGALVEGP